MTTRLVWFLIFLSALTAVATLGSFKKVFNSPTREVIALKTLEKMPEEKVVKNVEKKIDEVALGKEIYVQAQCVRCHGANGEGVPSEEGPMLAGQHDWYVYDQLEQIQAGERVNEKMYPFVEKLSKDDFKKLSKYVATLRAQ